MPDALRLFKAQIFQGLAHPTRIAILELVQNQELTAGAIIEQLGLEQANASQHLSILRAKGILVSRRAGNQSFYSIRDQSLVQVLEILKQYFHRQLTETRDLLEEASKAAAL